MNRNAEVSRDNYYSCIVFINFRPFLPAGDNKLNACIFISVRFWFLVLAFTTATSDQ